MIQWFRNLLGWLKCLACKGSEDLPKVAAFPIGETQVEIYAKPTETPVFPPELTAKLSEEETAKANAALNAIHARHRANLLKPTEPLVETGRRGAGLLTEIRTGRETPVMARQLMVPRSRSVGTP